MYPIRYLFRTVIAITLLMGLYGAHAQCTVTNAGPRGFNFPSTGGGGNVTVQTSPMGCTDFSISQVGTFFSAYKTGSSIIISCNANSTLFTRTGRINVGDIVIQINQCAALSPPTAIAGLSTVCYGSSASYTAAPVTGVNLYAWSANNGAVVTQGQTTSTAVIKFVNTGSTTVSVVAQGICGSSAARTYVVNSVANASAIPSIPGAITGSPNACVNTSLLYAINPVEGATSYTWSASNGTVVSGQGTMNVLISFRAAGPQTLSVVAGNNCGNSVANSLSVMADMMPTLTGLNHYPSFCAGEERTFSVLPFQSGVTYEWIVEGFNWSLMSGQGQASVNVKIGNGSGTIKVRAIKGGCESSQMIKEFPMANAELFPVTGNGSICPGGSATITLNGSVSGYTYTAYRNNQPVAGEAPSAQITVMGNGSALNFGPFTQEGEYTIKGAYTSCEATMSGSINVKFKPAKPDQAVIPYTTITSVCQDGSATLNVDAVPRATSYLWTVSGGTVASGQNTSTAQIQFTTSAGKGTVTVAAVNSCGTGDASPPREINVTTVGLPTFQALPSNLCAGEVYTFGVNAVAGNEYKWTVPSEWEIVGGQGTSSVSVKLGKLDGAIQVKPSRGHCAGPSANLPVDLIQPPNVFQLTGSRSICGGQSFYLNLSGSVSGRSYKLMRGETQVEVKNGTGSPVVFGPYTVPGSFKVLSSSSGSCSYPMDGEALVTLQGLSTNPTSINASASEICNGGSAVLTVNGGVLGVGAAWKWYAGSCTGTFIGTGSKIAVKPSATTTYYVKGDGFCNVTTCASVSISVVSCPSRNYNYVHSLTAQQPGYNNLPTSFQPENIQSQYSYVDALGRGLQIVTEKMSPLRKDGFSIRVYDKYGREELQYLPALTTASSGLPIVAPHTVISNFYTLGHITHPLDVATTTAPYSKIIYEASPLNRILKQGAAGETWQPDANPYLTSTDHTVKLAYESNAVNEVLNWTYTPNSTSLGLVDAMLSGSRNYFSANKLVKTKTKDEDLHEVIEFKDFEGRVILKQVQTNTADLAQTYYIYDNFGQLVCILPPEAVKGIVKTTSEYFGLSDAIKESYLVRWAFRYSYDSRGRMTRKQVPGAAPVYMIYDARDRIILTQDGNQRTDATGTVSKKEWSFIKYDVLNRPIQTGIYTHSTVVNQADMQGHVNTQLVSGNQFYEDYNGVAATEGYTSRTFPTSGANILTVNYYDDYSFRTMWAGGYTYFNDALTQVRNGITYPQPTSENQRVKGKVTGTKVKLLDGSNTWLKTITYYDDRYRVIQSLADNHKGGTDRTSTLFDFTGKVLMTKTTHSTSIPTSRSVTRRFIYDHMARLTETWHKIDALPEVRLVYNKYNELGQLTDKKLHSTDALATNAQQSIDYRYNIRGWLTSLNNSTLTMESSTNDDVGDYFGMNLGYNADIGISNSLLFNGNISGIKWGNVESINTINEKAYNYSYDAMNRLTGAVFNQKGATTWATPSNNGFVENGISYDLNGNILSLTRNDKRTSGTMDILSYNYGAAGSLSNRLLKVTDTGDKQKGFIDGLNTVDDYAYDANGNMITDQNKGITSPIVYNYLNLPQTVSRGANTINYIYDASGRKLAQRVTFGNITRQTDYIGELVYEDNTAQFINNDEGRAVVAGTALVYIHAGGSINGLIGFNVALDTVTQNGKEKYVKITSRGTTGRSGISKIGGGANGIFTVTGGDRYKIRVKGYRDKGNATSSNPVYISVKTNGTDLNWPGAALPSITTTAQTGSWQAESWIEQIITIPATHSQLQVGVTWNATVLTNEVFYLNEFEITKLTSITPEYQYNIKDHLGNVRLTFTTATGADQSLATLETANEGLEQSQFLYYGEAVKINSPLFNHTNDVNSGGTIPVTGLNVSPASMTLAPGQTGQLTKVILPANASNQSVNWTSSNPSVATVLAGAVTGVAAGVTTITAASSENGSILKTSTITVSGASTGLSPLIVLNFNENTGTALTSTGTLSSNFTRSTPTPAWSANAPTTIGGGSSLDFGTTNGNFVAESAGVIDGLKNMTAFTITGWVNSKSNATGAGGNRIVSWINNGADGVDVVYRSDGSLQVGIDGWPDLSPAYSSANKITSNASAPAGNWVFFAVTYQSSDGQVQFYFGNNTVDAALDVSRTYSSGPVGSNIGRLSIGHFNSASRAASTYDRMFKGLIDDIQVHNVALTPSQIVSVQRASASGTTVVVTALAVTPSTATLKLGQTTSVQLATTVAPLNATNQKVTWSSNNSSVATVNSTTGLVTAVASGTATITATSVGSPGVTAPSTVTVNAASTTLSPLIALKFNENTGIAPVNTGSVSSTFTRTIPTPTWSTTVPASIGGASSLDFGIAQGNFVVESAGVVDGLKNLTAFTITGWVNSKSNATGAGGNRIVSWINNGGDGVDVVYRTDGSLQVGIDGWPDFSPAYSSANKITTNASAPASNWIFFAVTYQSSNGQVQFYFGNNTADAVLDVTRSYSSGAVGSNIGKLAIGHFNSATRTGSTYDRMFKGLIDEIQVYNTALTPTEVVSVQRSTSGSTLPVASLTVGPSSPVLTLGQTTTIQLATALNPSNATNQNVTWVSNNPSVATVSLTGLVTAIGAGSAIITATSVANSTISSAASVTVNTASGGSGGGIAVTKLSILPVALTLTPGQTGPLTKTISPATATNQNVEWISSNPSVATVNASGVVTAVATGTATVTSTSIDGGFGVTATVTVNGTGSATYYSTRLAGTSNERYGLAKSINVMPGDVITTEVFVKYLDTNNGNWTTALNSFIASIAAGTAPNGTFMDGGLSGSLGGGTFPITPINHSSEGGTEPKAYLNYILFDKNMSATPLNFGFKRVNTSAREYGQDGTHQRLAFDGAEQIVITQPGYIYIYLSNENSTPVEVYFDDFKITHTKSPIIQRDDYYPYGLTFNSYQRENSLGSDIKYNSKQLQDELSINWLDYGARMYMPEIGRWGKVDQLSDEYEGVSPYCYALNDPVNAIDPDGNLIVFVNGFMTDQWWNQNENQSYSQKLTPHGFVSDQRIPNSDYRPYPGERTFSTGAPTYLGQPFEYWGNEYNEKAGIGGVFSQVYDDYNTLFISASADNNSQGSERFAEGITAANDLIKQLEAGDVTLDDGETIKIVGHSQGAAFAAGMVSVLAKHKKYSSRLEVVHYLSPHQPESFKHVAKILGYQWSTKSDMVSSVKEGNLLLQLLSGGSSYSRIKGIIEKNFIERENYSDMLGGHFAETWVDRVVQWANSQGIKVTVYE